MWYLGIVIYNMVIDCIPHKASSPSDLHWLVTAMHYQIPPNLSKSMQHLVAYLFKYRMPISQFKGHLWLDCWEESLPLGSIETVPGIPITSIVEPLCTMRYDVWGIVTSASNGKFSEVKQCTVYCSIVRTIETHISRP